MVEVGATPCQRRDHCRQAEAAAGEAEPSAVRVDSGVAGGEEKVTAVWVRWAGAAAEAEPDRPLAHWLCRCLVVVRQWALGGDGGCGEGGVGGRGCGGTGCGGGDPPPTSGPLMTGAGGADRGEGGCGEGGCGEGGCGWGGGGESFGLKPTPAAGRGGVGNGGCGGSCTGGSGGCGEGGVGGFGEGG